MSDEFSVEVVNNDKGWTVQTIKGGERSDVGTYPTEKEARLAADSIEGAATRYDGAATVEESNS